MGENRIIKQSNDKKIVVSLGKFYKSGSSLSLIGLDYRIPALQKLFSDHIAITDKAAQAHLDLNAAVAKQAESEAAIRPIRRALASAVKAKFGESSSTVAAFGFKPVKVPEKTAAVKAEAAEKANATKAAGGKKAKKKADAAASTAASASSTTTVAPAATATPATGNGSNGKGGTGT